jgi:phosphatidylserine/phosphatidylglycerophosphate/cardiolipin synthase-like enzyme
MSGLDFASLVRHKRGGVFPDGWPTDRYSFFSPVDDVHGALIDVISSAQHCVMVNLYGYDDNEIDAILHSKAAAASMTFLMNLDKSQAGGIHEKVLLAPWASAEGTSVAVGTSVKRAISHLKVCVVDHQFVIGGSTNWSLSGESAQDNELLIQNAPVVAGVYESILLHNHVEMLRQMATVKSQAAGPKLAPQ